MEQSKPTPGPWMTDGVVVWAGVDGDIPVCVMTSRIKNQLTEPAANAPESGLENARLISGAWLLPELVEALKHDGWCRACAEDGCVNCNGCTRTQVLERAAPYLEGR